MEDAQEPLDEGIKELADLLAAAIAGGATIEGAVRRISLFAPTELVQRARNLYERRVGIVRDLTDPMVLIDRQRRTGYWYAGPAEDSIYWGALRRELLRTGLGESMSSIDSSSTRIISLMRPPGTHEINTKGLVLGYVQSGKTTNFMSVIAKAADVGYRLFIVLSGITDNLRAQTQQRLEDVLVGQNRQGWFLLTTLEDDFLNPGNAINLLRPGREDRMLAVVKKNPYRLRRLLRWLDSAGPQLVGECPILLVDDEADQASVDVGTGGRTSRINGLIRQLLAKPKAAYLAYTATPFANLLIGPRVEDLYPRDFIVELPKPEDYFGPEQVFGRERLTPEEDDSVTDGLDLVRHVPDDEAEHLLPPRRRADVDSWEAAVTGSLAEAIRWFVLATAARRARGIGNRHSSMLIHTTMSAAAHFKIRDVVAEYVVELRTAWFNGEPGLPTELKAQWEYETDRLPPRTFGLEPVAWASAEALLSDVLDEITVVVDNYLSLERLSYPTDGPSVTAIVVGGNTLSRGLTLEGLTCNFFVRAASAYDTLLQMGRWFGFRHGYGDLVRIWMTEDLESWFMQLATVEEEVRREIWRYEAEDLTPIDVPVRIRRHPAMAITSAAKMRAAVPARISYSQAREQTILFNHRDAGWLRANLQATRHFISLLRQDGHQDPGPLAGGRVIFRDVPSEHIRSFLGSYRFHDRAYRTSGQLLMGYLDEQNQQGYLKRWSVVIMSHPTKENGTIDLGARRPTSLIVRARLDMPDIPHANIKALVSTVDRVVDLDVPMATLRQQFQGPLNDERLARYREDIVGDVGLLGIYPISRRSDPRHPDRPRQPGKAPRRPLDAVDDVIGLGIFFPAARGDVQEYTYMSADLSGIAREADDEDIAAIDEADERAGDALEARTRL